MDSVHNGIGHRFKINCVPAQYCHIVPAAIVVQMMDLYFIHIDLHAGLNLIAAIDKKQSLVF